MKTALILLFGLLARLPGADFVAPVSVGDSESIFPFSVSNARYQQVYGADRFPSVGPAGGWITAIGFRLETGQPVGGDSANFQINLSTTSRPVDGLSTVFADNIGSDERIVFGPADYHLQGGQPIGTTPHIIPLTTPFFYNPDLGNLLMEFRMNDAFGPGAGDVPTYDASSLSTDRSSALIGFEPDSLTGIPDTMSMITGFRIELVPEPSFTALALAALVTAFVFGLQKHHKPSTRKE